jgi:hypothetical protein
MGDSLWECTKESNKNILHPEKNMIDLESIIYLVSLGEHSKSKPTCFVAEKKACFTRKR